MTQAEGLERFVRTDLAAFSGYSAHTSPETLTGRVDVSLSEIIKIDANENPYGCSPRVSRALAAYADFNIYPDNGQARLREMLAGYTGVGAEHIVVGSGSNQLIDLVLRLLVSPGDEVINFVPTFGIYRFSTDLCGGRVVEVARDDEFAVDVSLVKQAITPRTKIIFLANPNSPTGALTPLPDIQKLLATGVPVMVDEAYYEFSGETIAPLVGYYDNLMVLRTFSKWAGLAGLRVGYGLFAPVLADYLQRTKIPYNVNVAALVAVEESLKDIDYLMGNVRAILAERERLFTEVAGLGWLKCYPTQANFILCRLERGNAQEIRHRLQQKGILVRYFDEVRLRDFLRFSVGKPEHTDALIRALREMAL